MNLDRERGKRWEGGREENNLSRSVRQRVNKSSPLLVKIAQGVNLAIKSQLWALLTCKFFSPCYSAIELCWGWARTVTTYLHHATVFKSCFKDTDHRRWPPTVSQWLNIGATCMCTCTAIYCMFRWVTVFHSSSSPNMLKLICEMNEQTPNA